MRWRLDRRHQDVDDEIRAHLSMAEADRLARGESADEARQRARREFGNVGSVAQATRDVSAWRWVDRLVQDLRHGLRRLAARPATTMLAIAMLGLAVGVTTAMFTLVDAFFLRPFPFQDADRIAAIWMRNRTGGPAAVAPSVFRAWRESAAFEAAEAVATGEVVLDTASGPAARAVAFVSPGVFEMLGVRPIRGRTFEAVDGTSDRVAISEDVWHGVFNGDPRVLGQRVALGGESVVVVGIMPREFRFPEWHTQIWRPFDFFAPPPGPTRLPMVYAKLAKGVPAADAMQLATSAAHAADPSTAARWAEARAPVSRGYAGEQYMSVAVGLLAGGAMLVFVVLSTNVGSLLLARFNARRRDVALSSALGASRSRLLWQACVESAMLGGAGAACGMVLAYILVSTASAFIPQAFVTQSLNPVNLDARALGAAAVLAALGTVLAGLLPAWIGTRGMPAPSALGRITEPRGARLLSRGFLVTQVALACSLLLGGTLLVRSFINLSSLDIGFNPSGIVSLWVGFDPEQAPDAPARWAAITQATRELARLPGVNRIVRSGGVPLFATSGRHWNDLTPLDPEGVSIADAEFESYTIGPDWFDMFGVRLRRGRQFQAREDEHSIILGARLAAALWPSTDPIGRSLRWGQDTYQVVGVAEDLRSPVNDLEGDFAEVYIPLEASAIGGTLSLRCDNGCPSEGLLRQRMADVAPAIQVHRFGNLETIYREDLSQPRAMALLGALFGILAVVVSAGGLFGVMGHSVGRRRREFGIRLVLGSTPGDLRRLVLREGLVTTGIGIALGAVAGWMTTTSLGALLYGVTSTDMSSWSLVLLTLVIAALAGTWQPAARATRIHPGALLREE